MISVNCETRFVNKKYRKAIKGICKIIKRLYNSAPAEEDEEMQRKYREIEEKFENAMIR